MSGTVISGTVLAVAALTLGGSAAASVDQDPRAHERAHSEHSVSDSSAVETESRRFDKMKPCLTENSQACAWDANHLGNGEGRSFWATNSEGRVVYYRHKVVHRIIWGEWEPVPPRLWDERADLIKKDRSRAINKGTLWSVGPETTLFVWAGLDRIDFQVGTS